ncbi:MAG: C39 family peptidase [Rubripirellula sp.]
MVSHLRLTHCALLLVLVTPSLTNAVEPHSTVLIRDVPHVFQKPDFCGEACVASWLQKIGFPVDQDTVFDASGLDPSLGRGCYTKELAIALRNLGFDPGPVWHRVPAVNSNTRIQALWELVLADLDRGIASIVCMRTGDTEGASEHFRLLLGYDSRTDEVIYHEPAEPKAAYRRMAKADLLRLWPLKYQAEEWQLIRFPLGRSTRQMVSTPPSITAADYSQHIMKLRSQLPGPNFTVLIEPPFVVIGNESRVEVERRAEQTVRWATKRLKAEYFSKDPSKILNVWLFKDRASYDSCATRLFGRTPTTPYGYYSSVDSALVMNISTGGGTLVHEIVHPFVESNFPNCPAWFNEGLGSLYEQSSSRGGRIIGLTNWRLAGLQQAISRDEVPSFATLCSTTTQQFYREDPGTNYAQARYLCYYLQEKGLLKEYYHGFVANHASDPTGYATLRTTLGVVDMDQFKKDWEKFVMQLRFNR